MKNWTRTLILPLLIGPILLFSGCAKYAVLISTGNTTTDNNLYHSEYWYDLFLHYQMLRENGFEDDHIYVLYGNGNDFPTGYLDYNALSVYGHTITDMAVTKSNIQTVFNDLSTKIDGNDYLYVWWMGHGGGSGPDSCNLSMSISTTGESVTDTELTGYLNAIPSYDKRSVAVMTCHSGGLVDNLNIAGSNTVVLTSSTCTESSYSDNIATCNSRGHAEHSYHLPNALRQTDPCGTLVTSDSDGSGSISLQEAHDYTVTNVVRSTPQLGDADAIADRTVIERLSP